MNETFNQATRLFKPLAPLVLPAVYDDVLSYEEWLAKVVAKVEELRVYIVDQLQDVDDTVTKIVNEHLATINSEINRIDADLKAFHEAYDEYTRETDGRIEDVRSEGRQYTDEAVRQLDTRLTNNIRSLNETLTALIRDTSAILEDKITRGDADTLDASKQYANEVAHNAVNKMYLEIMGYIHAINEMIDNLIKEYPHLYDPATGYTEDMQTLVYNLYRALRWLGIRAMVYDDQQMSAEKYDAMGLTAIEYDAEMLEKLGFELKTMFNPFTGKQETTREVLQYLINTLRWNAKTRDEYDGYEATASEFDASDFEAYEQDNNKYITTPDVDTKNKSYRNWLFLGSGDSVTVPDSMVHDGSQFGVLTESGDITELDPIAGTYGDITIAYTDNVYTITGTGLRVYVISRVYKISELDK